MSKCQFDYLSFYDVLNAGFRLMDALVRKKRTVARSGILRFVNENMFNGVRCMHFFCIDYK